MSNKFNNFLKIFFALAATLLLINSESINVLAKTPELYNLIPQKTMPGTAAYKLKRAKEKVFLLVALSQKSKFSYRQVLLGKRLSEIISLVDKNDALNVTNASQRFAYEAGMLAETASKNKERYGQTTLLLFEKYKPILEELRDNFPANSAHWLLIQQDIDTLNILSDKLK